MTFQPKLVVTTVPFTDWNTPISSPAYVSAFLNYHGVQCVGLDLNIEIYNTTGQKITTLVSNKQAAGAYKHTFLAQNTGVYFVKINIGAETAILRMVKME